MDPDVARAFVVQEKPQAGLKPDPQPDPKPDAKPDPKPSPVRIAPDPTPFETAVTAEGSSEKGRGERQEFAAQPRRRALPAAAKQPEPARLHSTLLVPVTVRLRPEIASALKRASLERQLNGVSTFTQQDIVEEALLPWLRAEGLLD